MTETTPTHSGETDPSHVNENKNHSNSHKEDHAANDHANPVADNANGYTAAHPELKKKTLSTTVDEHGRAQSILKQKTLSFVHKGQKVEFFNIKKSVNDMMNPTELKEILHDISGSFSPGEVSSLMGPSGSGKTTLLNMLHPSRRGENFTGTVLVDGRVMDKGYKRRVAYVLQQDIMHIGLTVREQLTYTALLKLPQDLPTEEKEATIDTIISILKIDSCAFTPIMLISGGEKKRVNIGSELLTDPSVLLLDEPTSGLDSTSARQIVEILKDLATGAGGAPPKTVVSSIHQPNSAVFFAFDKLVLLADGYLVYYGTPDKVSGYLSNLGFVSPPNYNAADFMLDVVQDPNGKAELKENFKPMLPLPVLDNKVHESEEDDSLAGQPKWPTSYLFQLRILSRRAARTATGDVFTFLNFVQAVALAVIVGLLYLRLDRDEDSVPDRDGVIFFTMVFWPFNSLFTALFSLPMERMIINKERDEGMYRLSAYFFSKSIAESPLKLLLPSVYLVIVYWMANLNPSFSRFLGVLATQLLGVFAGESIGLFVGTAFGDTQTQLVAATVGMLGFMLLGGFFVDNVPVFLEWARFVSIFKYARDASLIFEFRKSTVDCNDGNIISECEGQESVGGREVLDFLDVDLSAGENIAILISFIIFFRVAAYFCLRFIVHGRTRL